MVPLTGVYYLFLILFLKSQKIKTSLSFVTAINATSIYRIAFVTKNEKRTVLIAQLMM
jgi:hypothetical protein